MANEVETRRPYQIALAELKGRADMQQADGSRNFEVAASVADKILTAETVDEILAIPEQGTVGVEHLVGKPFRIIGGTVDFPPSAEQFREGGTGYYVLFRGLDMNDNEFVASTGSQNIVFQMKALFNKGLFDDEGVVTERYFTVKSRSVASGTLYWLASA